MTVPTFRPFSSDVPTVQSPDAIRAQTTMEIRLPLAIDALRTASQHLNRIPVIYDVNGQCLHQAIDDIRDAIAKIEHMRRVHS